MSAALAAEAREDVTLGDYASLFGFLRSAVMQEGRLVEMAVQQAVQHNSGLLLLPAKPMPIVPAAQEMLKRTPADQLKGVRFPVRVHSTETYRPDLFVVNRTSHIGLILDIKRSLASYRPQEIDRLRFRMLAVAAIAPEWIAEHQRTLLVGAEIAIIDGADEISDHERGVFRLSEIDHLLEAQGAAESIKQVREEFSSRVQEELARRCRNLATGPSERYPAPASTNPVEPPEGVEESPSSVVPLQTSPIRRFGYARRPSFH
ncbi:hypothetical protein [Mesorhizobium sp.]|uniref:hypothetical protein n=2 Tax=Mesorhizobium sp. TaxID=1871066 RepID=UPI0025EBA8D4|nr:hypothetical protein [Mesorhizobium sp.]